MEDYKEKYKIGDRVRGKRTFNGEIIEGKFNGFYLFNKLNPNSVVGVIMTDNGCYDVSVDSLESVESEDERIRKALIRNFTNQHSSNFPTIDGFTREQILAWLEKQGEQKPIEQDTETRDLWEYLKEWKDKFGRLPKDEDELASCIDFISKRQKRVEWNDEDEKKRHLLIKVLEVNHPNAHFKVNPINTTNMEAMSSKELVDWLKSLRPQNRWKPSDLQLEALESAYKQLPNIQHFLQSLYNDLKKL